jgi:uncharacterized protein (TIGR03083 family)
MNLDDAWHAIDEQRLTVAALLEELNDQEWTQPSLCEGWTVRDVAAHLTLQQIGPGQALAQIVRRPGGMNRMIHNAACRRAAAPTDELIAAIRGMVGSRKRNVGVSHLETLTDILVHGQDIAIPLGRHLPTRTDAAAAAASRMWSRGWPFWPRRRLAGFRLVATDTQWVAGEGRDVEGRIEAVLLLLTGRLVVLPRLSGDGIGELRARLAPASR